MPWFRQILIRGIVLGVLAAFLGAGALFCYVAWLNAGDRILPGVIVGQTPVGLLRPVHARTRVATADPGPEALRLHWGGHTWLLSPSAVTTHPDLDQAVAAAGAIGHTGTLWHRTAALIIGLVHGHYVPLHTGFEDRALLHTLQVIGGELETTGSDTIPDVNVEASLQAIKTAIAARRTESDLVVREIVPARAGRTLAQRPTHEIARFATPVLAADSGRVRNITLAAQKLDGMVVRPGNSFSFNLSLGPRDAEHGWAPAAEIYRGEFVMGYGGGICQVSSTLYNAVLLAGLRVTERHHHDLPLEYVPPGRDATVAWSLLDFRFQNPLNVPVMVGAHVLPGAPQRVEVSIFAPGSYRAPSIQLIDEEVRYVPPQLVEIPDPLLTEHDRHVVDEGSHGVDTRLYRIVHGETGERRELIAHDQYPPRSGKVRVGVKTVAPQHED